MLHLKMIVRSWGRNALSTAISVVSLVVGLVCATMFILFTLGEYRVANAIGGEGTYLLERQSPFYLKTKVLTASTAPDLASGLASRYGEVEHFATINEQSNEYTGGIAPRPSVALYKVTSGFMAMFDMPVLEGDLSRTLLAANEIAVTPKFFTELYGRAPRIGDVVNAKMDSRMVITVDGVPQPVDQTVYTYTVTAILDDTGKLPFKFGALTLLTDAELNKAAGTYFGNFVSVIKLRQGADFEAFQAKALADTLATAMNQDLTLTPYRDVYFSNRPTERFGGAGFIQHRDPSILPIGIAIAFAVLLIAVFNYINITMTRARGRIRNIAAERIFGAGKAQVRWHTVMDTLLLVVLSFGVALIFIHTLLPQFNGFMECNITLRDLIAPANLAVILGLLLLVVLLSSIYILVRIDVKSPLESLKNPTGKSMRISGIMVVAQFVISVVLIAVSINISRQINFATNQIAGSGSILQLSEVDYKPIPKDFTEKLLAQAWAKNYTTSSLIANNSWSNGIVSANSLQGDDMMFDLYNIELISGRYFAPTDSADNVIVNEALVRAFGLESPADGQEIDGGGGKVRIVGVVRDFVYENIKTAVQPLIISYVSQAEAMKGNIHMLYVKVDGDAADYVAKVGELWTSYGKSQAGSLNVSTLKDMYADMHTQETRLKSMVNIFMYISILLTALGLFGLSYYTVQRRTHEIALRKVHGATTRRMVGMLCTSFFKLVAISVVLALPVAYYVSAQWLSGFAYKVGVAWWVFGLTVVLIAVVTFVTVIFQTWRAANANPAKSIKFE